MKRAAWQATVHRITKSRIRLKRLRAHTFMNSNGRQNIFKHAGNNYLDIKEKSDPRDWKTFSSVQSFSHVQLFATPWITHSMQGLPVHHQLPEFTQTHVHWVGDAIQPSHPLSSPSPPAPNPSQHQGLFQWVNSLHEVAKVLEFQLQHQSFQWTPRTDLL